MHEETLSEFNFSKTKGQNYAFQGHAESSVPSFLNWKTPKTKVTRIFNTFFEGKFTDKIYALKPYTFMLLIFKCKTAINVGYARLIETLFMHALIIK